MKLIFVKVEEYQNGAVDSLAMRVKSQNCRIWKNFPHVKTMPCSFHMHKVYIKVSRYNVFILPYNYYSLTWITLPVHSCETLWSNIGLLCFSFLWNKIYYIIYIKVNIKENGDGYGFSLLLWLCTHSNRQEPGLSTHHPTGRSWLCFRSSWRIHCHRRRSGCSLLRTGRREACGKRCSG